MTMSNDASNSVEIYYVASDLNKYAVRLMQAVGLALDNFAPNLFTTDIIITILNFRVSSTFLLLLNQLG